MLWMLLFQFLMKKTILTCKRLLIEQMDLRGPTMAHPIYGNVCLFPILDRRFTQGRTDDIRHAPQPTRDENEYDTSRRVQRGGWKMFPTSRTCQKDQKTKGYLLILLISLADHEPNQLSPQASTLTICFQTCGPIRLLLLMSIAKEELPQSNWWTSLLYPLTERYWHIPVSSQDCPFWIFLAYFQGFSIFLFSVFSLLG